MHEFAAILPFCSRFWSFSHTKFCHNHMNLSTTNITTKLHCYYGYDYGKCGNWAQSQIIAMKMKLELKNKKTKHTTCKEKYNNHNLHTMLINICLYLTCLTYKWHYKLSFCIINIENTWNDLHVCFIWPTTEEGMTQQIPKYYSKKLLYIHTELTVTLFAADSRKSKVDCDKFPWSQYCFTYVNIYLYAQMEISKGPEMGGEDGRTLHLQGPDITGGGIKKSMYQENVFQICNIPTTHWPVPYMANLILIQLRTKNFSKTAVFWHMTVNSLVPDYMASNRETATCTVTAARPPNLKKEILFFGPQQGLSMFWGVQQWILSWKSWIRSKPSHTASLRRILTLLSSKYTHLPL